ncbi:hypothetical protein ACFBC7_000171 [Campylobacter jejuni]
MANNEFNFNNRSFFNEIMTMFEKIKKEEQENNKLNVLIWKNRCRKKYFN